MFKKLISQLTSKSLVRLLRENVRKQALNYSIAIVAMIIIAVTSALTAWIMKDIINSMMESGNRAQVLGVATAVAAIFTVKGLATYVQMVWLGKAGNSIVAHQQRKLYSNILKHSVSFFNKGNSSDLLMRVTMSAQGARRVIDTIVTGFARDFLTLVGLIFVMFYQQPFLSLFSLIFGPIAILGVRKILSYVRDIMASEMTGQAEIMKIIQETSAGIRVVKAFDLEESVYDRMDRAVRDVEKKRNAIRRLEAATSPLMETLAGFAIASVVALSTLSFFGQSPTSAGQLMSFITAVLMAYEPAKRLAKMRVNIETGMRMVDMMYQVLDRPVEVTEKPDAIALTTATQSVEFQNVDFEYQDANSVIKNLNITFEAGKTTALVGPSGGGKSTIINLIMRLYDPTSGSITIGGTDLRDVTFSSLRQQIAFVGQDTFLFDGSIITNIAMGLKDATEEQVFDAAKAANAHDFIMGFEAGYDTRVGENGAHLSGGQRQRISIARALLRQSPILLMDEATSALDSGSEVLIKQALDRLTEGRTTVLIAHRLSTIMNADKIVVIDSGRVAEQGDVSELLERNGLFRELYDHQFTAGVEEES
ncbi:ABC transporter ATP-binding protein [uncultured Tateyamaria sp.]|uniref:ABC transporter ATP-binding protein n=1 Tax=uncultured Tateyamaria sp. TaxID=455651 RepID=UPI0026064990|nr:ABC transporter ATP-binding protein [uncultured Tateyamaria sp.]